ncbi:uncharacterized protein V1516DRAFT_679943 [Lipomyces oligophaga]|uniref:uncharacterized protein n=1 Tax=Lipomyces oligophaga TaxID=45792 RepID=UPI0034CF7AEB
MPLSSASKNNIQRVAVLLSFGLAAVTTFYYLSGRGIAGGHQSEAFHRIEYTPFTPSVFFVLLYWVAMCIGQIAFLHQFIAGVTDAQKDASRAANFLTLFNVLHFLWLISLANRHFFSALVVMTLSFLLTGTLYWSNRTHNLTPVMRWLTIHLTAAAMPFAWSLFALFWTGAIAAHSHNLFGRLIANIFIWALYVIPTACMITFADWGLGFAEGFLVWGLFVGQILVKTIALQWIFAVIIASLLTVQSGVVLFSTSFKGLIGRERHELNEETPLIH